MNPKPLQDLSEAFNGIISMMLSALRARGLRALLDLPNIIIASIYLRRLGREFAALVAAFQAGTLKLPESAATPDQQATCAQAVEPRSAVPAKAAGRAARARPVSAAPATPARRTRAPSATRRQPCPGPIRAPNPRTIPALRPRLRDYALREADRRP